MVQVLYPDENKNGGGDGKFHLRETACGKDFDFQLKRNRVKVLPADVDWQKLLTEDEKLQLFRRILKEYRIRSQGDDGLKLAALGITETGDIYIATNTERLSSPYFRQCAELNVVTCLTQNEVYKQLRHNSDKPSDPRLTALYMIAGWDNEKELRRPICPCGNCTDMLSHVMTPGAPLYVMPLNEAPSTPMNSTAKNIQDIQPGHAWKTTIEVLNTQREVTLSGAPANEQRAGFRELLHKGVKMPEEQAKELADRLLGQTGGRAHNIGELVGFLLNPVQVADMPRAMMQEAGLAIRTMLKSAENALLQRQSVPELDATADGDRVHLAALNRFMVNEIQRGFADRLREIQKRAGGTPMGEEAFKTAVNEKIGTIRCVVLQMDDGTFRFAVEARSKLDNAAPSAEMSALASASQTLGTRGVRDAWVMEMTPKDIARGNMHTSTKEGAERLIKRRSRGAKDDVQFHFIPFNPGTSTDDGKIAAITMDIDGKKLFPSLFLGSKQAAAMR